MKGGPARSGPRLPRWARLSLGGESPHGELGYGGTARRRTGALHQRAVPGPLEVTETIAVYHDLGEPFAELARRPPPTAPFDDINLRPLTQPASERGLP